MAQTENGIGFSYKLPDGTMIWGRRDSWAECTQDIKLIFGEAALEQLELKLQGAWGAERPLTAQEAAAALNDNAPGGLAQPDQPNPPATPPASQQTFDTCPVCGSLKNKWVPPGTSSKTGRPYRGFYACPTPRCPGR